MNVSVLLFFCLFICSSVFATTQRNPSIEKYIEYTLKYPKAFGPKGLFERGEVELVDDPQEILEIQETVKKRLLAKGVSPEDAYSQSRAGIMFEDRFWMWVRDPVRFPSGLKELYNRFIHKKSFNIEKGSAVNGVGVLPCFDDQKVLVNIIFRHATRSWEIEIPRGGIDQNESFESAAKREVKEETGYEIRGLKLLGSVPFDTGSLTSFSHVYLANVGERGQAFLDGEEVIPALLILDVQELKEAFVKGGIEMKLNGHSIFAHCRDPLLSYALLNASLSGLLSNVEHIP